MDKGITSDDSFYTFEDYQNEERAQKIFAHCSSDKGLKPSMYKELKKNQRIIQLLNGQMNRTDSSQKNKHKWPVNT
jgi:hypothetical protein